MRDQERIDAHPTRAALRRADRMSERRTKVARGARIALAGALAFSVVLGGVPATADIGGGGVGGSGNGGGTDTFALWTGDSFVGGNPQQGWGQDSINAFASAMEQQARWTTIEGGGRAGMQEACTNAINQAIQRSNGASNRARVVQVGTGVGQSGGQTYIGWGGNREQMIAWYDRLTSENYWQPQLQDFQQSALNGVANAFRSNVPFNPRTVCVALNDQESIPNYTLSISTDKQATFSLAGSTGAVHDRINASASNGIRENVTARVTLHWGGVEGNGTSRTKNSSIANSGSTNSQQFTPGDFGWSSWPAGDFWFDVAVDRQARMSNGVFHGGRNDSRESWNAGRTAPRKILTSGSPADQLANDEVLASGQFYNAEVTARTNGFSSSMTINDVVNTDQVFIGSSTADNAGAAFVRDPNGNRVGNATIDINRGNGTVRVSGTVTNIPAAFQAREYTLVVPTYVRPTGTDYEIRDSSSVCYTGARNNCIDGNGAVTRKVTASPDKVWVLDENGALVSSDPGQTNEAGVANKSFAPGSGIGAVVNGSIPAKLAERLSQYSLTDDWTAAADYIDFSDAGKAKVFFNGTDVTSEFAIAVDGTTTVATARSAFLDRTKGLGSKASVKLFIGGQFRTDFDTAGQHEQLSNSGSERWNNEVVETNSPAIYAVSPNPDKVWVIDEDGALSASDPDGTNGAGVAGKTFAPGAGISAVVNGTVPANLGRKLDSYVITDDWSAAAEHIDFSDASKAKVFLNGADVTDQFDIAVADGKTIATAKAAFLDNTAGLAQARSVKLFVTGTIREDFDTDGDLERLVNTGSEAWNGKVVETNSPAIFTISQTPDKVWVIDEEGALGGFDPEHTGTVGVGGKTFAPGAGISAVVNGSVPADLGSKLESYIITDDWTGSAGYIDFSDVSKVKVFLDGANVTSQFDVRVEGTQTIATAKAAFLDRTIGRATTGEVKLFITGNFRNTYDTAGELDRLYNAGSEQWNGKVVEANTPAIYTVTPTPDNVWVLDEDGALSTSDKDWTNKGGANELIFLHNDAISAVVNGSIPADLGSALESYTITDDWSAAAEYVDFSDATLAKVFYNGTDVTAGFDINVEGTKTIAKARAGFLAGTLGLAQAAEIKLVVTGFFRDDYDTDGEIVELVNAGSETWNSRTQPTNQPPVFVWTPNPNKQVLGSSEESGDKAHDNIQGTSVWPGQKLEYSVGIDLRVPAGTGRGIKSLVVEDVYDPYLVPDKPSVEFWDSRSTLGPKPVPRSAYELRFDEAAHTFTATFTDEWIAANVSAEGANDRWLTQGWLTMRFTGTVAKTIPQGNAVTNQAFQIINGGRIATESPEVTIPVVTVDKASLNTDDVDIDGKTVVGGDVVVYRLLLDGGPARSELAYNVHKLGIVDDFDDEYLALTEDDIVVTERETGADVTGKFNVQIKDGVAYVFAKTVDTKAVYGGTIAGDPQPEDLKAYDEAPIRPLEDAIIDQELLGKQYWVTLRTTVKKDDDGHVITNEARQNIQNTLHTTRIVSNPVKDIDPTKDVVISEETKNETIEGTEVRLNTVFNYRINSSEIPAERAYSAKEWSITDQFDRVHDQYTGIWAIYANTDVYDGNELLFKKGALLADSAEHESEPWKGLFDVSFDQDSYELTVTATAKYLELIGGREDVTNAFSVYTKMLRIAPAERIENVAVEAYNGIERPSNATWTFTNEYPSVAVLKFTLDEGPVDGSHGDPRIAHELTEEQLAYSDEVENMTGKRVQNGVEVGIHLSNTGDTPLVNVALADVTHTDRFGQLQSLSCLVPADPTAPAPIVGDEPVTADDNGMVPVQPESITELAVGESIDCVGVLREMAPGMTHGDTVIVTGESIFTGATVKDDASWFAVAPSTPGIEVAKYTLAEGREDGSRQKVADALALTETQAKDGVQVAFDVTNTGDEPLIDFSFVDETRDGTTGQVEGIKWLGRVVSAEELTPGTPVEEPNADPTVEPTPGEADSTETVPSEEQAGDEGEVVEEAPAAPEGPIVEIGGAKYVERPLGELTELAVGQTVLLVGTLTGVEQGSTHTDVATVTASALYSGTEVEDDDLWNAKRAPAPVATPQGPQATGPNRGAIAGEAISSTDQGGLLGGAALLLVAAALVAEIMRRRMKTS